MPDITTLFEATDGVSRALFNQKLSDVNKHGNDGAMHVTEEERGKWNGKANGNNAVWVAINTIADANNPNDVWMLTIPNFVFTEGCQVTFQPTTKPSGNTWTQLRFNGGAATFVFRNLDHTAIDSDAWEPYSSVTVTLSSAKIGINGNDYGDGTAFFKSGSGSIKEMFDFPLSIQTAEPAPVNTNHIWIQNDLKMPFTIDEAIRATDWGGDNRYYAIVDNTDNNRILIDAPKKTTDGVAISFVNRHMPKDNAPWVLGQDIQFAKKYGIGYWSVGASKWPRIMSRLGSTIDVENAKRWDGSNWQWLSQKGKYLAVGKTITPFLKVYNRAGDTFPSMPSINTVPNGSARVVAFSPDGVFFACAHDNSPYVRLYKRSGDAFVQQTFSTQISKAPNGITFSPDGLYLALSYWANDYLYIYKRSGDTFVLLESKSRLTGACTCKFSPDGVYLIVGANGFISIYKRSGDTFTSISDIGFGTEGNPGRCMGIAYSPNSEYILVAIQHLSSQITTSQILKRSGDTFLATSFAGSLYGASFCDISSDGIYFVIGSDINSYIRVYKRSGDTFTPLSLPANGSGYPRACSFSADGVYLVICYSGNVRIYKRSGDTFTSISDSLFDGQGPVSCAFLG